MVKFFCDRCGIEIKPVPHVQRDSYYRIKKITKNNLFYSYNDQDTTTVHLCNECQNDLADFIDHGAAVKSLDDNSQ